MPFQQRSAGDAADVKREAASQFPIKSMPDKNQCPINRVDTLVGSVERCLEMNLGGNGRFVGTIDAGEVGQLSAPRFGVKSFGVAALTFLKRRVDKDLQKLARFEKCASVIPLSAMRTDERDNHNETGVDE
jgi:hypothetical protein